MVAWEFGTVQPKEMTLTCGWGVYKTPLYVFEATVAIKKYD